MAYSRYTLNKREKQTIGVLLILALFVFLNDLFPRLKAFWAKIFGQGEEVIDDVGNTISLVAIGWAIVQVSKVVPTPFGRLAGMVLGYGLILSAVVPLLMSGKTLQDVLSGVGNGNRLN